MTKPTRVRLPVPILSCRAYVWAAAQLDQETSLALLDDFREMGGNFVDTGHIYTDWLPDVERSCSGNTIGRWLSSRGPGPDIVVATKTGHPPLDTPHQRRLD